MLSVKLHFWITVSLILGFVVKLYFAPFISGNQQNNKSSSQVAPDTPELTEAELRFMSEQMGDTDSECKNL